MRTLLLAGLALASAASLGGCASNSLSAVLTDLDKCDRDYTIAIGSGGSGLSAPTVNGSAHISCKAEKTPAPTTAKALAGEISAAIAPAVSSPAPATSSPPA